MGRVSQWAVRSPWYALLTWVGIVLVVGVLGTKFGGDYTDNFQLPDTESTTAQDLLSKLSGGGAGTGTGLDGQVVWSPASGSATQGAAATTMKGVLTQLSTSAAGRGVRADAARPAVGLGMPAAARAAGRGRASAAGAGPAERPAAVVAGGTRCDGPLRPGRRQP